MINVKYEIFACTLWVSFLAIFIAFMVLKSNLVNELTGGSGLRDMYYNVFLVGPHLFEHTCIGEVRIQDCPIREKEGIFHDNVPDDLYFDIAGWMEKQFECAGYSDIMLQKYSFTNYTVPVPDGASTCNNALQHFLDGISYNI